jgi:division protein CdvB (Snf7/Vps24/ESCRT-III family)
MHCAWRVAANTAGLLKWVLAMVNYYNVAKGVEPKRKKVAEAEKNLRLAQKDLADTKDQLAALNAQLASFRSQFADKTAEQQVSAVTADTPSPAVETKLLRLCICFSVAGLHGVVW